VAYAIAALGVSQMADRVDVSGGAAGTAREPTVGDEPHLFGLPAAMAPIVGSIIGVGIFNLPTSLAFYGPITLVLMALTTVGAPVLALLLGIPVYLAQRRHMSQPAPVPPYR